MAKMKAALSSEGIKHFFLKHTEKLVLGLVCLFILLTLASTQWTTYSKPPAMLEQNLQEADRQIASSTWAEEEKFPPVEVDDEVDQMLAGPTSGPYSFNTPIMFNPTGSDQPRQEPIFVAVANLKADSGRTILAQQTEESMRDDAGMVEAEDQDATDESNKTSNEDFGVGDDFAARETGPRGRGEEGMMNPYGGGGEYYSEYEEYEVSQNYNETVLPSGSGSYSEGGEYSEEGMGMMGLPSNIKGVPVRYVSVRGVFDLRQQIRNYSRALGIPESEAQRLVEFVEFKLERQKADTSSGPWSDWEPVDINVAVDYLEQTVDFDDDVVSSGVRDPVITMPLPARLMGVWRNKVNHPQVKNFELSDEELALEEELNRKILEDRRKKNQKLRQKKPRGGFSTVQLDVASMQQDYFQETDTRQISRMFDEEELKGTPEEVRRKLIEKIKAQVSAAGNLVLFRYIDFDIEAGKAYRYRVSLELRNPNYGAPIDQVADPSVVVGDTRDTPFSEPSNVTMVSPDYAYFVRRVDPPRGISNEMADMQVFQWYDSGTLVRSNLSMEPGDYIGGKTKTHVLRPDEMTYEVEDDVKINTDDLLVDALAIQRLDYNQHRDLQLPQNLTRGEVGVVPEVLVVDADGKLKTVDPITSSSDQKRYERNYTLQMEPFEKIKDSSKKKKEVSELDALLGGSEEEMMEYEMMMQEMDAGPARLQNRRRSPTRR